MNEILDAIERNLVLEREAILRMDAAALLDRATEKERLWHALAASCPWKAHRPRIEQAVATLRRNVLLLAHARDLTKAIVGDAATIKRGVRLSVSG